MEAFRSRTTKESTQRSAEIPVGLRLLLQHRKRVRARGHSKAHRAARSMQDPLRHCSAAHRVLLRQLHLRVAAAAPQLPVLPDKQAVGRSCAHLQPCMPMMSKYMPCTSQCSQNKSADTGTVN